MVDYISREAAKQLLCDFCIGADICEHNGDCNAHKAAQLIPAADVVELPEGGIGEMSDGYHTFNSLYNQRLHLFAALCNAYPDRAWKSKLHEDGTEPFGGGWFIVGIDTPEGSYTYHYELKDWALFKCPEIERGKPWDGHTDKDVKRLLSIPSADVVAVVRGRWIWQDAPCFGNPYGSYKCECGCLMPHKTNFCPNCGADMRGVKGEIHD